MARSRRIVVSLSADLLASLDGLARQAEGGNRSACVRRAIRLFLREQRRAETGLARLRKGYELMGGLNRRLAEEGLTADSRAMETYETVLAERERD